MTELRTPLEIAIISGDLAAVDDRLACGDAPGDRNHLGIPVLYDALRSNNLAILELLHKVGADWAIPLQSGWLHAADLCLPALRAAHGGLVARHGPGR
ncbi:MAG: hypothetical protein AAF513_04285 [Pseudomonadota bacterium]